MVPIPNLSPLSVVSGQDLSQPPQSRDGTPPACRQCRARKVKCDRQPSGCLRCARLGFTCSYVPGYTDLDDGSQASPQELTQAGTKRRRIPLACAACRTSKTKCSGADPCGRCSSRVQPCVYRDSGQGLSPQDTPSQSLALSSPTSAGAQRHGPTPEPPTPSSVGSDTTRVFSSERKDVLMEYVKAYFDKTDISECQFLHRATVMAEWNQNQLDANLLKAICASGMHLLSLEHSTYTSTPQVWMTEVRQELFARLSKTSIADLQTLLLVIKFRLTSSFPEDEEVWILMSIAARVAFTKRLNYERPIANPVRQECLRRMMWTVFYLDKLFSGGIEDLTLCPTERMHIRLPSNDRCFQRGLKSRSHFLRDPGDRHADMDALAYRIKIFDIRDRIFRYTRRVVLEKSSPFTSREELRVLDEELATFRDTLPEELGVDGDRLRLMCHSAEARTYIVLHCMLRLSRCDLYRFLIPGIRESVSREAMENTPSEYIDHCQRQCLQSALSLCDLWSEIHRLQTNNPIGHSTVAIAAYQVANIIAHLFHLLPEAGGHSLEQVKSKLTEALSMIFNKQKVLPWVDACLADIRRLIPNIGLRAPSPGTRSPPDAPKALSHVHRRSKHAYFVPDSGEPADSVVSAQSPTRDPGLDPVAALHESDISAPGDWNQSRSGIEQAAQEPNFMGYNRFNPYPLPYGFLGVDPETSGDLDMPLPLDPFDLQLNSYSDARVPLAFPVGDE